MVFLLIDALIQLIAIVVLILVIIAVGGALIQVWEDTFLEAVLTIPDFGIGPGLSGPGNHMLEVYHQIGLMAFSVLAASMAAGIAFRVAGRHGAARRLISRPLMLCLVIVAFPYVWDIADWAVEDVSLWILNPLYSFDPGSPCPAGWGGEVPDDVWDRNKKYIPQAERGFVIDGLFADKTAVCRPELRVHYLLQQSLGETEFEIDVEDPFVLVLKVVEDMGYSLFVNMFMMLAKAVTAINMSMVAFVTYAIVDVLIAVSVCSMPMFAVLSMIPRIRSTADRFLTAIPALLMLPVLTSLSLVAGSSVVAAIPSQIEDANVLYTWIAAVGVMFFTVGLPVMLVPMVGALTTQASQMVSSSVMAATTAAGFGAMGAAGGAAGGGGKMGALKGGMKGSLAGLSGSSGGSGKGDRKDSGGGDSGGGGGDGGDGSGGTGSEFMSFLSRGG